MTAIKPGMKVCGNSPSPSTWVGEVLAVDGEAAWVRWTDTRAGVNSVVRSTLALGALREASDTPNALQLGEHIKERGDRG